MKTLKLIPLAAASFIAISFTVPIQAQPAGRGMPAEARDTLHTLFNHHGQIVRTLTLTETGYVAVTTSTNPAVAAALKKHVGQMSERLKAGLMVRRWDPAFAEYASYYDAMDHRFEPVEGGIKATVTGRNAAAIKVAQNHAKVIVDFAVNGWEGHDRSHPAALATAGADVPAGSLKAPVCCLAESSTGPVRMQSCGTACCRQPATE